MIKYITTLILTLFAATSFSAKIKGKATYNNSNNPVVGAEVILKVSDDEIYKTTTDEQGFFIFENIKSGSYGINAWYRYYDSFWHEVKVTSNAIFTVNLILYSQAVVYKYKDYGGSLISEDLINMPCKVVKSVGINTNECFKKQVKLIVTSNDNFLYKYQPPKLGGLSAEKENYNH